MLKPYTLSGILTRSHVNGFNEKKEKKGKVNTEIDKYEKRKKNTKKTPEKTQTYLKSLHVRLG